MAVEDIEYVELYTSNRQSAVEYFVSSLGFAQVAESVDSDTSSALLRQAGVQLMVTTGPGTHEFLDAHGDGVVDIALTCDDPAAARDAAVAAGAGLADSPAAVRGVRDRLCPRVVAGSEFLGGRPGRRDAFASLITSRCASRAGHWTTTPISIWPPSGWPGTQASMSTWGIRRWTRSLSAIRPVV
jgi:4-hydroxyphenylpyruvate dioxygenase-like putative hemolysin